MNTQHALPATLVAEKGRSAVLDAVAVAGLMAMGAWIRLPLPFTPVPVTLQTLPVLLAAFLVGRNRAMAGALLYMVFGLAGAPVLAVGATFGATFGYLAGFVAAPWVVSRFRTPLAGLIAATLAIYAFGATWLSLYTGHSLSAAVLVGVAPFLPGDALKAAAAYGIIRAIRR
ncbi:MAG: biotin transporter BioY [Candidatus Hydrogenedentota bacterium]